MRIIVDENLIVKLKEGFISRELEEFAKADSHVVLGWPALLELLDIHIIQTFPLFTQEDPLYREIIAALEFKTHPELLEHLFDQVFVLCLKWVRSKEEIHPKFLLDRIREKIQQPFLRSLHYYERILTEDPYLSIHNLTLYLAWDRVCVLLGTIFEYSGESANIKEGMHILRNCLVESFQHITQDKKTVPGFFRLVEALYAFQMREEHLQTYSDPEWQILSESVQALRSRDVFLDVSYVDHFIFNKYNSEHLPKPSKALTMDSWDKINKSLTLSRYMIDLLEKEDHGWRYDLFASETISLG